MPDEGIDLADSLIADEQSEDIEDIFYDGTDEQKAFVEEWYDWF